MRRPARRQDHRDPQAGLVRRADRLTADPAGQRLAIIGWNAGTYDSVGVAVVPLGGRRGRALGQPARPSRSAARFLDDGSLLFTPWDTPESAVLYKMSGPGRLERLGRMPRPIAGISVSRDLKRIAYVERNYHGDAFMSRIVRR